MKELIKRMYIRLLTIFFVKEESDWAGSLEFIVPFMGFVFLGLWHGGRSPNINIWIAISYMATAIVLYVIARAITAKTLLYGDSIIYRVAKTLLLLPLKNRLGGLSVKVLEALYAYPEETMQIQISLARLAAIGDKRKFWFLYDALAAKNVNSFLFPKGNNNSIMARYKLLARYLDFFDKNGESFNYSYNISNRFEGFIDTLGAYLYPHVKEIRIKAMERLNVSTNEGVNIDEHTKKQLNILLEPADDFKGIVKEAIKIIACRRDYNIGTVAKHGIFANITPFEGGV